MHSHIIRHLVTAAAAVAPLAMASTGIAAAAGPPAAQARAAQSVTAYVTNRLGTVTPIRTATNTALKPITVGIGNGSIAITPNGKTAYVTSPGIGMTR